MKILIVANGFVRAGVSRVLSLTSQAWQAEHQVDVSFFKKSDSVFPIGGKIVQENIPFQKSVWSQVYHLNKIIKKGNYDRIYGFSEDANYPLAIAAKLAGVSDKTVLTVHNPVEKFSPKVVRRVQKYYSSVYKVIAVSNGVRKGLISLGVDSGKVIFRPNPIDLNMVQTKAIEPIDESRLRFGKGVNFISAGRLHPHKGFDILIKAFQQVLIEMPDATLSIIGDGPQKSDLNYLIDELGLGKSVFLMGALENPFPLIKAADIYVMSSRLEGWPLVLMEAMGIGKPVISFACPNGPDEIINNKLQGWLIEAENQNALSQKMVELAKQPEIWQDMSSAAQLRMQDFELKVAGPKWIV